MFIFFCLNKLNNQTHCFHDWIKWISKLSLKDNTVYTVYLNSVLGPYFPLRTACLFFIGQSLYYQLINIVNIEILTSNFFYKTTKWPFKSDVCKKIWIFESRSQLNRNWSFGIAAEPSWNPRDELRLRLKNQLFLPGTPLPKHNRNKESNLFLNKSLNICFKVNNTLSILCHNYSALRQINILSSCLSSLSFSWTHLLPLVHTDSLLLKLASGDSTASYFGLLTWSMQFYNPLHRRVLKHGSWWCCLTCWVIHNNLNGLQFIKPSVAGKLDKIFFSMCFFISPHSTSCIGRWESDTAGLFNCFWRAGGRTVSDLFNSEPDYVKTMNAVFKISFWIWERNLTFKSTRKKQCSFLFLKWVVGLILVDSLCLNSLTWPF